MSDWFQWAIVAFIVVSILFHVWKGGSANPVGTAKLQHDVSNVRSQVTSLGTRVQHVEEDVKELKQEGATAKDVKRIEDLVDARLHTVRAEMQGHRDLSQATNESVKRIERLLIEKGLGK